MSIRRCSGASRSIAETLKQKAVLEAMAKQGFDVESPEFKAAAESVSEGAHMLLRSRTYILSMDEVEMIRAAFKKL